MKDRISNIAAVAVFIVLIYGLMLTNIIMPDREISYSERRRLARRPEMSTNSLLSGEWFESYEKYLLDQFVMRDEIRGLKALVSFSLLKQKDNNGIYVIDDNIFKMEYPLNERSIMNAAGKLNEIYDRYLAGKQVYYAIIPDKNYFVAKKHGYLSMDYERLQKIMKEQIENMDYIDLFQTLKLEDYYRTDIHWRQESLTDVANLLLTQMGADVGMGLEYEMKKLYPFYGSYYGQAALPIKPDNLTYLTNEIIESALVYDHIDKSYSKVYMEEKFGGVDSYDIFLSGAKSVISITNPAAETDRELIIFRDSFGSSIAPLLLKGYARITLVDLRYTKTDILADYIDFSRDADVLFLYNTMILNNSYMLK